MTVRDEALAAADRTRSRRREVQEAARAGQLSLAGLFELAATDPDVASMKLFTFMYRLPGSGKVRAGRALDRLGIDDTVRVDAVPPPARQALLDEFGSSAGRLIVVSGPSGVGKGTVVQRLANRFPFHLSVSATTRPTRPGEEDGVAYHFIDEGTFRARVAAGEFLEWAEYSGSLYGTPRSSVDPFLAAGTDVILVIEVERAKQVRAARPDALLVFLVPPSAAELEQRLRGRGDTADIAARLEVAQRELESQELFDHVIVNDDLVMAVAQLESILSAPEEIQ